SGRFGVQFGRTGAAILEGQLGPAASRPSWVILAGGDWSGFGDLVTRLRGDGIEVLVEATSLTEVARAVEIGADGLILKGHEAGGRVGADTSFILVQKWRQWADRQGGATPVWVRGGVGPNTAAACLAAGVRGVVLDSQVLLARESPLSGELQQRLA